MVLFSLRERNSIQPDYRIDFGETTAPWFYCQCSLHRMAALAGRNDTYSVLYTLGIDAFPVYLLEN
jgi:hypothetical protein